MDRHFSSQLFDVFLFGLLLVVVNVHRILLLFWLFVLLCEISEPPDFTSRGQQKPIRLIHYIITQYPCEVGLPVEEVDIFTVVQVHHIIVEVDKDLRKPQCKIFDLQAQLFLLKLFQHFSFQELAASV